MPFGKQLHPLISIYIIHYISINYFNPLIIWEISMECADEAEDFSDITGSQNARVFVS